MVNRKDRLITELKEILEDASGMDLKQVGENISFIEMGLDSLFLTQTALTLSKKYGVKISFRQLNETLSSFGTLADYLDKNLPADAMPLQQTPSLITQLPQSPSSSNAMEMLIMQQMQMLQMQLQMMRGSQSPVSSPQSSVHSPQSSVTSTEDEAAEKAKPFGAIAKIEKTQHEKLSPKQQKWIEDFTNRYNEKTKKSKAYTQNHRSHLADPRVVTGFKPAIKELIYQVVVNRSLGTKLWDIDGNEYTDVLNGFGSNFLGYGSPIVMKAVEEQLKQGIEIGPQHPLAGEITKMICEFTGFDRAALCNTGSEAVLGVMRMARTVTGRNLIVMFNGSYHGINDEVIVRGTKKLKSFPAAAGIPPGSVESTLILDYGTPESLEIIRSRANDLAAVMVEPIQSRRADFHPKEFLQEVRKITEQSGTALIFDEVITGFRLLPGGAQEYFGVKSDLGSYGKIIGGGMPIGVMAGKKEYMDALDGGQWQFGDGSVPEAGVTYFAGTFVRHPLALAATKAVLTHLKEKGKALWDDLNGKTKRLVDEINDHCKKRSVPFHLVSFGSLFKAKWEADVAFGELVFLLLRYKGVHIYDGFPCFLTTAFTDADVDFVIKSYCETIDELFEAGFLPSSQKPVSMNGNGSSNGVPEFKDFDPAKPPVPGARVGKDLNGNPGWFIPDPERPGKYLQVK